MFHCRSDRVYDEISFAEGVCPSGKQSVTRAQDTCSRCVSVCIVYMHVCLHIIVDQLCVFVSRNWRAECLWDLASETWTWQYTTSTGELKLHADSDPCAEPVVCVLPKSTGMVCVCDDMR